MPLPYSVKSQRLFKLLNICFVSLLWTQIVNAADISIQLDDSGIATKLETNVTPSFVQKLSVTTPMSSINEGDIIHIELEQGNEKVFKVLSKTANSGSIFSINASSSEGLRLLLSVDSQSVYGSINGNGHSYTIASDQKLGLTLVNHRHEDFPEIDFGHDAMVPPTKNAKVAGIAQMSESQQQEFEELATKTGDVSVITMLFVYSPEFGQGFGSPVARINDLLNFTNQAMADSDIYIRFTLARAQELDFDNNLSTSTTLNQATFGQGAFSGVAALRDEVGADMVAVLSFANNFSANGIAWVNGDNPDLAFSSTRLSPQCCNSVFAHELGHNLGSGHERASVNSFASGPCSFNFTGFSCGHGNAGRNWGTLMSRLNSENAGNVFSNPLADCLGEPCGVAEGSTEAADNTRSFNMSRLLVANFRDDPPGSPVSTGQIRPRNDESSFLSAIFGLLFESSE